MIRWLNMKQLCSGDAAAAAALWKQPAKSRRIGRFELEDLLEEETTQNWSHKARLRDRDRPGMAMATDLETEKETEEAEMKAKAKEKKKVQQVNLNVGGWKSQDKFGRIELSSSFI